MAVDIADRKAEEVGAEVAARRKVVVTAVAEATARHRAEAVHAVDRQVAEEAPRHQAAIPRDTIVVEFDCASIFLAPVGGRQSLPIHRQEVPQGASCTPKDGELAEKRKSVFTHEII